MGLSLSVVSDEIANNAARLPNTFTRDMPAILRAEDATRVITVEHRMARWTATLTGLPVVMTDHVWVSDSQGRMAALVECVLNFSEECEPSEAIEELQATHALIYGGSFGHERIAYSRLPKDGLERAMAAPWLDPVISEYPVYLWRIKEDFDVEHALAPSLGDGSTDP